jgi:hypothetical protein
MNYKQRALRYFIEQLMCSSPPTSQLKKMQLCTKRESWCSAPWSPLGSALIRAPPWSSSPVAAGMALGPTTSSWRVLPWSSSRLLTLQWSCREQTNRRIGGDTFIILVPTLGTPLEPDSRARRRGMALLSCASRNTSRNFMWTPHSALHIFHERDGSSPPPLPSCCRRRCLCHPPPRNVRRRRWQQRGAFDHAAGLLPLHLVPQSLFLSLVVDDVTVGHVLFPLTHSGWCGVSSR